MRPLSEATSRIAGKTFSRKYIALGRIVNNWEQIVGKELSAKATPVKIHYRNKKSTKVKPSTTLDIAVSTADATLLHYQKDLILERINQIFGERWITSIRFVQSPANKFSQTPKSLKSITADEQETVQGKLKEISDDELHKSLETLGLSILKDQQGQK